MYPWSSGNPEIEIQKKWGGVGGGAGNGYIPWQNMPDDRDDAWVQAQTGHSFYCCTNRKEGAAPCSTSSRN